ncbi:ADP-ribosylation factor GTPase activator [Myriangium duriaei CBS 260.36]|uniref:ADP-ribosylation factor GTPase activator n=1 Tax=Myriangium duriaei CBS 260.36 TaxID=1168546 RepID=A0A9P4IZJ5_9PEZI|nr:ADP-ribosylation factor GTPase activator [Myriangium duriaei CBS 260.36]
MSNKLWEVDPQTKSKLQEISKTNENNRCVDCGAPSPQWASPKFGIFFCLSCSGVHRSLGVHISFVRSITMDSFKVNEVERMAKGGNKPWKDFFDAHQSNKLEGRTFDDCTINERYDSEAGEEWKERLTAKVEGKEYVPGPRQPKPEKKKVDVSGSGSNAGSRSQTPLGRNSPAPGANPGQKAQNEAYFARMGAENANRRDDLAPNQGGKYGGFGSAPMPSRADELGAPPGVDDFQKDPVGALTKGLGWLGSTVSKQANAGYKGWVQPNMQKFSESDFARQAQATAGNLGQSVQAGARGAATSFNRFVEGDDRMGGARAGNRGGPEAEKRDFWDSFGAAPAGPSGDKKDFWDDFAAAGDSAQKGKPTSIGTSAMKKPGGKKDEDWGEW